MTQLSCEQFCLDCGAFIFLCSLGIGQGTVTHHSLKQRPERKSSQKLQSRYRNRLLHIKLTFSLHQSNKEGWNSGRHLLGAQKVATSITG